jgi:hypothetical protein
MLTGHEERGYNKKRSAYAAVRVRAALSTDMNLENFIVQRFSQTRLKVLETP